MSHRNEKFHHTIYHLIWEAPFSVISCPRGVNIEQLNRKEKLYHFDECLILKYQSLESWNELIKPTRKTHFVVCKVLNLICAKKSTLQKEQYHTLITICVFLYYH